MSDPIRVAICDDHGVVRSGLCSILAGDGGIDIVGEVGDAAAAVALAAATSPDVFVMDLGLPGTNGIEATREVVRVRPATAVLVLTVQDDVAYLRRAFDAGARGYLLKDAADIELVLAVNRVASGDEYVHPALGAKLLAPDAATARPSGPADALRTRGRRAPSVGPGPHKRRYRQGALHLRPYGGDP